jgi:hypothetical protein
MKSAFDSNLCASAGRRTNIASIDSGVISAIPSGLDRAFLLPDCEASPCHFDYGDFQALAQQFQSTKLVVD